MRPGEVPIIMARPILCLLFLCGHVLAQCPHGRCRIDSMSMLQSTHKTVSRHGRVDEMDESPISSCDTMLAKSDSDAPWVERQREAAKLLCADEQNRPFMDVFVDKRFKSNYARVYGKDGWVDEAWVTYFKLNPAYTGGDFQMMVLKLIESVHRFSKKPIVMFNFGTSDPDFSPERFPRLVILKARNLEDRGVSFNFNKFQAAMLAKVKVGASLDADMMMADPEGDSLLARTKDEITKEYPYPMMPVHFLDRDPANLKYYTGTGNYLVFECESCPKPTMRWGQAQPSWTYWSFPFLARWQAAKIAQRSEQGVPTRDIREDEDLLNVALWQEGASKQWCMWQTGGVGWVEPNLYGQATFPKQWNSDRSRYLNGTPMAFFFGHAEKKWQKIEAELQFLSTEEDQPLPKAFYHDQKYYATFKELKDANPDVEKLCTM